MNVLIHEKAFVLLEDIRKNNPSLTYWLRQKNNRQRIRNGHWFPGHEHYAAVGLYRRGAGLSKTKSICLIFTQGAGDRLYVTFDVIYKGEADQEYLKFYRKITDEIDGFQEKSDRYVKDLSSGDDYQALRDFIENDKPKIDALIRELSLKDMFISNEKFNKSLKRTLAAKAYLEEHGPSITEDEQEDIYEEEDIEEEENYYPPLNQLFHGPPGTGKTYRTITEAVAIANPFFDTDQERLEVKTEYNRLVKEGKIVFTTFHQSLTYEDFVEGIKPLKPEEGDEFVKYDIVPGIFKTMCDRARKIDVKNTKVAWDKANFYKMSLGGKQRTDIHEYCIEQNVIALGWGEDNDLSKNLSLDWKTYRDGFKQKFPKVIQEQGRSSIQFTYAFQAMQVGDIVLISKGNHLIDAIGIVRGEYYYDDDTPIDYYHFRKVEWIATDLSISPDRFVDKKIPQQTIYQFSNNDIKLDAFRALDQDVEEVEQNYVLIIDEINRGNVSQIFGELITLLEEDKRQSAKESIELILPYSKERFSVPPNLYIIGTMNTADRSVEALDTALRRRFSFIEIGPDPELLHEVEIEDLNLPNLLATINKRVEILLDKDHCIGHAYFMELKDYDDPWGGLHVVFSQKILPLLQEYFYGDLGKIQLILGKAFCQLVNNQSVSFAKSDFDAAGLIETEVYHVADLDEMPWEVFEEAVKQITA